MSQDTLFDTDPEVKPLRVMVEYCTGMAAARAFGEKPTAAQRREAERLASDFCRRVELLRLGR